MSAPSCSTSPGPSPAAAWSGSTSSATVVVAGIGVLVLVAARRARASSTPRCGRRSSTASPWVDYLLARARRHPARPPALAIVDVRASSGSCSASGGSRGSRAVRWLSGGDRRVLPRRPRAAHDDLLLPRSRAAADHRAVRRPPGRGRARPDALQRLGLRRARPVRRARPAQGSARGRAGRRAHATASRCGWSRCRRRSSRCCPRSSASSSSSSRTPRSACIITYPELLDAARRFGSGNGNILQALVVAAADLHRHQLRRSPGSRTVLAGRVGRAARPGTPRGRGAEPACVPATDDWTGTRRQAVSRRSRSRGARGRRSP